MARSFLRGEHLRCRGVFLCCVSDGCLSSGRPFFIRNVSPTAYVPSSFSFFASGGVLSFNSERKLPKNASRNPWFLHFLWRVQELLPKSCRSRELTYFYSRCRCIGRLKKLAILSWGTDCHIKKVEGNWGRWKFSHKIILSFRDQSADWSWESVSPGGRPTRPFT